jgi:integrase
MRYRIKWETTGPDGKRRHHSATRSTKKEAESFLVQQLTDIAAGTFVQPTKDTVATFLAHWLETSRPSLAESTAYAYACVIRNRINPHLGATLLSHLDQMRIQHCYAQLTAAGYSAESVKSAHTILHSALRQAVAWRLLPRNPADGVRLPASRRKAPVTWTAEEAASFLAATQGHQHATLWRLALDSGMRIGELLALAWQDIDLERATVAIRRTLTHSPPGFRIGEFPKTASSRRSVVIGSATLSALRAYRARQAERRLALGGTWVDLGLVFDRGNGTPHHPGTIREAFDRAVRSAGVARIPFHGMRHTTATLMLAAGIHPKIVQERLGHASIQMTLDRYSHVSITMQHDAAATLDRVLENAARPQRGHDAV